MHSKPLCLTGLPVLSEQYGTDQYSPHRRPHTSKHHALARYNLYTESAVCVSCRVLYSALYRTVSAMATTRHMKLCALPQESHFTLCINIVLEAWCFKLWPAGCVAGLPVEFAALFWPRRCMPAAFCVAYQFQNPVTDVPGYAAHD